MPKPPPVWGRGGTATATAPAPHDAFELFWKAYPKKEGRREARKEFLRVVESGAVSVDRLIAQAKLYASANADVDAKWICKPRNWLKAERYNEDWSPDPEPKPAPKPKTKTEKGAEPREGKSQTTRAPSEQPSAMLPSGKPNKKRFLELVLRRLEVEGFDVKELARKAWPEKPSRVEAVFSWGFNSLRLELETMFRLAVALGMDEYVEAVMTTAAYKKGQWAIA